MTSVIKTTAGITSEANSQRRHAIIPAPTLAGKFLTRPGAPVLSTPPQLDPIYRTPGIRPVPVGEREAGQSFPRSMG